MNRDQKYREHQKWIAETQRKRAIFYIERAFSHAEKGDDITAMGALRMAAECEAADRAARRRSEGKPLAEARCCVPGSVDREDANLEALDNA